MLKSTGYLAAVMKTMGHKDVKTAMRYQHPEIEIVPTALNQGTEVSGDEQVVSRPLSASRAVQRCHRTNRRVDLTFIIMNIKRVSDHYYGR
jgi:poly-beta-hydroxyalkanoate depolymerase